MKTYKKLLIGAALFLTGGVTTYATTNAFINLDSIQGDFDSLLSITMTSKKKV